MNEEETQYASYEAMTENAPMASQAPHMPISPPAGHPSMPPSIMDAQGAFAPQWYSQFNDLKAYAPSLAKFKRPEALAKSYAALERMKGYPGVEDASQMEAFRRVVGLPESSEDYSLNRPENTPDELWDEAFVDNLGKLAYEYGVPAAAMNALTERYCEENARMQASHKEQLQHAIDEAESNLQLSWGTQYENNLHTVGNTLRQLGERAGVDVQALTENPALRANADFAKVMLEASKLMQEAPLRTGSPSKGKEEAYRIAHDPTHPLHEAYMRTSHPQHRYANDQYDRLAFGHRPS